jgi:probable F420-dependent oxidoreductase
MLDPAIALAFVAGRTTRIRLGTGIIILPQRNAVVLAKELASLDVLSNGRLIFGIGVGYLKPEFDAIGAPFDHKGARSEEWLAAMIALWSMPKPEFSGKWINFKGVNAMPRPVQQPHPEIVFGGHTKEAYSRTARLAKGWYGFAMDVDATAKCIAGLKAACKAAERRFEDVEISVTPHARVKVDVDMAKRYAELGVSRLILLPRAADEAGLIEQVRADGRELVGKV